MIINGKRSLRHSMFIGYEKTGTDIKNIRICERVDEGRNFGVHFRV